MAQAHGVNSLPTQPELNTAVEGFKADWGAVDEVLYRVCRECPGHDDRRRLIAKVVLVGRAYAAGLERCLQPPPGKQAITVAADHMHAERVAVDDAVERVRRIREPLGSDDFSEIVAAHGALLDVLAACCNTGKTPRSFAAKYLHFHAPVVPIYDSYAASALIKLVHWDAAEVAFACPAHGDAEYWDYCVRFLWLCEACRATGHEISVKTLDAWLWSASADG